MGVVTEPAFDVGAPDDILVPTTPAAGRAEPAGLDLSDSADRDIGRVDFPASESAPFADLTVSLLDVAAPPFAVIDDFELNRYAVVAAEMIGKTEEIRKGKLKE